MDKLVEYRVEFFHIGSGIRECADCWEAEEWRYPNLTVTDYMELTDWELPKKEAISGIIVTLFIGGKPVSCVWWHKGIAEEFDIVFELTEEERN